MSTASTENSISIGSFAFSLRLSFVIVSVTVDPAGIDTPLEPATASFTVAVSLSPTLCVFVQISLLARTLSALPAAIVPVRAAVPDGVVLVLPLAVLVGAFVVVLFVAVLFV